MEHYLNQKSLLLNNKKINTFLDPIQKIRQRRTVTNFFVENNDKIKKQMLLFQHVDYFKKFEKTHPEIYNAVKESFALATCGFSLDQDINKKTKLENDIISTNLIHLNQMMEKLYWTLNSEDRKLCKKKDLFVIQNDLLEDIIFNLFFKSELFIKATPNTYNNLFRINQGNNVSLLKKIVSFFNGKNKEIPHLYNDDCKNFIENINQIKVCLQNKNTTVEFYEKTLNSFEKIDEILTYKLKNISMKNILNLGEDMNYKLEDVPEFYISLGLFLCSTAKINNEFLRAFSKNIEKIATSKDKEESIKFMKNYLLLFKDTDSVNDEYQKIKQMEQKSIGFDSKNTNLLDKYNTIIDTFKNYELNRGICKSEYLPNIYNGVREVYLKDLLKKTNTPEKNLGKMRAKI